MIKDHGLRSHSLINTSGFLLSSVNRYLQIHENLLPFNTYGAASRRVEATVDLIEILAVAGPLLNVDLDL